MAIKSKNAQPGSHLAMLNPIVVLRREDWRASGLICMYDNYRTNAMPPMHQFKRFDVREMIRDGIEPFPAIRKRVDALVAGQGLLLIAPFLPSPLIEILSSDGFASKVERGAASDWRIYFWREGD